MKTICNSVRLIGNLGRDPEIKNFEDGKKLAKVSLATSDRYKNTKGEWVTETQWHNLVAWGKPADLMERFLKKGAEVTVNGRIVNRNFEDKEGHKKYITEIVVTELYLPGKKKED